MAADTQNHIVHLPLLGRRLRAARIAAGFDSVKDVPAVVFDKLEVHIAERTIYALERGEQMPSLSQFLALGYVYDPPGGDAFFAPAFDPRILDRWKQQLAASMREIESRGTR